MLLTRRSAHRRSQASQHRGPTHHLRLACLSRLCRLPKRQCAPEARCVLHRDVRAASSSCSPPLSVAVSTTLREHVADGATFGLAIAAQVTFRCSGLPHITIPSVKLEPGRGWPAFGLAEAERRADQALAARLLLEPAVDSRARNEGARHCSAVSSSRSALAPRAAS